MILENAYQVYNASAGSGKTHTMVKEYLKILLQADSPYEFQKILAITFTNKAATEMKQRVLNTLKEASQKKANNIVKDLFAETLLSEELMVKKSREILNNILQNYSSFHITTIDSFTHKLIRTFSLDLGLPLDFEVEMDADTLLTETIDLLVANIGADKELTNVLIHYTLQQVNDDKSWNINNALVAVAKLLLNEENELQVSKLINTNLADFQDLEKRLKTYLINTEKAFKKVGEQALCLIDERGIEHKSFSNSDLPNYFKKFLGTCLEKEELPLSNRLAKNMGDGVFYTKSKSASEKVAIDAIKDELSTLFKASQELCNQHFGQYLLVKKILKSLVPLAVLNYINKVFTQYKKDNNFRLNAEFNRVISKQIKNEPVPFIYERLGEKYQYFFIDEMQDTSELQWQNLIPLIDNALSQGTGKLMLVGDAKQSIYRWRGGKASQFVGLSDPNSHQPFYVDKKVVTLDTNYRSYSNIINFNNDFFAFISQYLKQPAYQEIYAKEKFQKTNTKQGGHVRLELFEIDKKNKEDKHEVYAKKIEQLIVSITETNTYFNRGDICVLTRKKDDGTAVADYLISKGINVISPDSLLLKNNKTVQLFMYLLKWIDNPKDKEVLIEVLYFLHAHLNIKTTEHAFYETSLRQKTDSDLLAFLNIDFSISAFFAQSLYDGVEYMIRSFKLQKITDVFVQAFLDFVLQFQLKKQGSLQSFLQHWDKKKGKLKVELASSKDAVQIMTIHKSKGLEFPVVIFSFDLNTEDITREKIWFSTQKNDLFKGFDAFQIPASSKLALYGEEGENQLNKVQQNTQLDYFNLLYVALTRAEEQLYILSDTENSKSNTLKSYSDYFKAYLTTKDVAGVYELGTPEREFRKEETSEDFQLKDFKSIDKRENNICVVQNQNTDEEARAYGNLIHKAFEKLIAIKDLPLVFAYIHQQGLSVQIVEQAKALIKKVVTHPSLHMYYQKGLDVYTEQSFLNAHGEINIMDRLIFNNNEVVVIDYKTGVFKEAHQLQINNYENILSALGYQVKQKLLVYCNDEIVIK